MSEPSVDPSAGNGLYSPTIAILPPLPSSPLQGSASLECQPATDGASTGIDGSPSNVSPSHKYNPNLLPDPRRSSPRLSSTWDPDFSATHCTSCHSPFDPIFNRRHHCRLCGRLFCHSCSNTRSLIPPSALVLKETARGHPDDASITYVPSHDDSPHYSDDTLLYGRGLERRILLARHPQRTCHPCRAKLAPLQPELCWRNSNAVRYNYVDEGDALRRFCNSPLAFTLGHEVRKAAYALGNLLPGERGRRGGFVPREGGVDAPGGSCRWVDPTLRRIDGVRVPSKSPRRPKGVAVATAATGGLGVAGYEFGTGLGVARKPRGEAREDRDAWTAPSAIGIAGFSWGALLGAQVSDHVFLLMTDDAVRLFASRDGRSIQLGVDVGVAVGPLGRSAEADIGATTSEAVGGSGRSGAGIAMAPIYTYSLSKGLYAGVSLDGRVVMTRPRVNEKFYGRAVTAQELLSGQVPNPPAAQPLYDALKRCRVYGGDQDANVIHGSNARVGFDDGMGINIYDESSSPFPGGGLMERWSHATGAGMPAVFSSSGSHHATEPYNLAGRGEPALMAIDPTYDEA